ncbi:MAG: thioredoxin domain-containing protein [Bdellovibrionaceae bacterium]|nr:thioredoxin domain-containing protein [Pseudobdellovibrionaceae bacterium]
MKKLILALGGFAVSGCVSSENQIREAIKKNPDIVFEAIEENPVRFIESVNRAAQKAQQAQYEQHASEMKKGQERDLKNPKQPKLSEERRLIGDDKAPIVLVEYVDFQCPACKMASESLKEFKQKHKNDIQVYYKNMPLDFHPMAFPAALYFEAIRRQDKVKALKFYEHVFAHQRQLKDEAFLKKAAAQVGAHPGKLAADVKSAAVKKTVAEDMAEFQAFGFNGTPTMILNGIALSGVQPVEKLEEIVELTRKK